MTFQKSNPISEGGTGGTGDSDDKVVSSFDMNNCAARIDFAGYCNQVRQAFGTLCMGIGKIETFERHRHHASSISGLSTNSNDTATNLLCQLVKPPKGMILYGPQGVGKTRLMYSMLEAVGCSYIELPYSILLAR